MVMVLPPMKIEPGSRVIDNAGNMTKSCVLRMVLTAQVPVVGKFTLKMVLLLGKLNKLIIPVLVLICPIMSLEVALVAQAIPGTSIAPTA